MTIHQFDPHSGYYAFTESNLATHLHAHPALEVVVAREGRFAVSTEDVTLHEVAIAVVAPNQPHALQAEGAVCDLFFVEPGFKAFQEMARLADDSGLQQGLLVLDPSLKSKITLEALQGWETNSGSAETLGDRVVQAVRWIQQHPRDAAFSLAELAREVHLSPSRLSHLFKAQMGVSIQKYAIWNRMKTAVDLVVKQEIDLTQAAYAAGFYDLAHFSKHFKEMFGVTPSLVYNNSRIVQVHL